jgi:hypothetical protein
MSELTDRRTEASASFPTQQHIFSDTDCQTAVFHARPDLRDFLHLLFSLALLRICGSVSFVDGEFLSDDEPTFDPT